MTRKQGKITINRFGNPNSFANFDVQDFIRIVGITREQLDELLAIKFNPDLVNIKVSLKIEDINQSSEYLQNLNSDRLDFIHRLIRLWQKTSWSISELDLVLDSLKSANLINADLTTSQDGTKNTISSLAQVIHIQEKLNLTVEELCAMFYLLPVSAAFPQAPAKQTEQKLFERLFDRSKLVDPNNQGIDNKIPVLISGLGISETEARSLLSLLNIKFDNLVDYPRNRQYISLLYRHARVAKALTFKIDDFIQALNVISPNNLTITSLEQIHQLIEFKEWVNASPFNVSEISFILKGTESNVIKYKTTSESIDAIIQEIQKLAEAKDQKSGLKNFLLKTFNLTTAGLDNLWQWLTLSIDSVLQDPQNANHNLLQIAHEIEQLSLLFSKLKFEEPTISYLSNKLDKFGIAEHQPLFLDNLKALTIYQQLITLSEQAEPLVQNALDNFPNIPQNYNISSLAELWQENEQLITSLSLAGLTLPSVPIEAIAYLWECLNLCQTLGINGSSLPKLVADDKLKLARDIALGAFSST